MSKRIKHISFLYRDERLIIESNTRGKFKVPVTNGTKTRYKHFTATEVLQLREVRNGDPSLTMESGEKIRVYQGGDPSYLPASVEGVLVSHDSSYKSVKLSSKKPPPAKKTNQTFRDEDQGYFDWYGENHGF